MVGGGTITRPKLIKGLMGCARDLFPDSPQARTSTYVRTEEMVNNKYSYYSYRVCDDAFNMQDKN